MSERFASRAKAVGTVDVVPFMAVASRDHNGVRNVATDMVNAAE